MTSKYIAKTEMIVIKGDAWDCTLKPRNVRDCASLVLRDYDENKKMEAEISIDFNKEDLDLFISCLSVIKQAMV